MAFGWGRYVSWNKWPWTINPIQLNWGRKRNYNMNFVKCLIREEGDQGWRQWAREACETECGRQLIVERDKYKKNKTVSETFNNTNHNNNTKWITDIFHRTHNIVYQYTENNNNCYHHACTSRLIIHFLFFFHDFIFHNLFVWYTFEECIIDEFDVMSVISRVLCFPVSNLSISVYRYVYAYMFNIEICAAAAGAVYVDVNGNQNGYICGVRGVWLPHCL